MWKQGQMTTYDSKKSKSTFLTCVSKNVRMFYHFPKKLMKDIFSSLIGSTWCQNDTEIMIWFAIRSKLNQDMHFGNLFWMENKEGNFEQVYQ